MHDQSVGEARLRRARGKADLRKICTGGLRALLNGKNRGIIFVMRSPRRGRTPGCIANSGCAPGALRKPRCF